MKWHYATNGKAVMPFTFDIDVFIFTYLETVKALLKAVSFIDLNPLGASIVEKQQSDRKITKCENKQSLIMRWQQR